MDKKEFDIIVKKIDARSGKSKEEVLKKIKEYEEGLKESGRVVFEKSLSELKDIVLGK